MIKLKFKKEIPDVVLPSFSTSEAAAFDFYLYEDVSFKPYETKIISTGLSVEIPQGYYMEIFPRSSIGLKTPLRLANSVGIIDSDYRGIIGLIFTNTSQKELNYEKGFRLAQGILKESLNITILETTELNNTIRGNGGFGSTGL